MNTDPGPCRARDLMTSPVLTVPADAPREAVAALLVSHGIASAPVVDARGRLLGVVDERHLVAAADGAPAAEVMAHVPVADPDTPLDELVDRLLDGNRAVPVVREDVPVGIVSRRDVLRRVARGELVARGERVPGPGSPVVVGIDGSEGSVHALRWAARAARAEGAPLVALTASGAPDLYGTSDDLVRRVRQDLEETVRRALGEDATERHDLTLDVREGRPARVLVHASEGARLIVVGSRHVDGVGGPPGGSVTAQLVSRACCPVVAVVPVRPEETGERAGEDATAVTAR